MADVLEDDGFTSDFDLGGGYDSTNVFTKLRYIPFARQVNHVYHEPGFEGFYPYSHGGGPWCPIDEQSLYEDASVPKTTYDQCKANPHRPYNIPDGARRKNTKPGKMKTVASRDMTRTIGSETLRGEYLLIDRHVALAKPPVVLPSVYDDGFVRHPDAFCAVSTMVNAAIVVGHLPSAHGVIERMAATSMSGLRLEEMSVFAHDHGLKLTFIQPDKWYYGNQLDTPTDQRTCLDWFVNVATAGVYAVRVIEFDGSQNHVVCIDVDHRQIIESSSAHTAVMPLTVDSLRALEFVGVAYAVLVQAQQCASKPRRKRYNNNDRAAFKLAALG
jgi:hypothetical protein